MAIFGQDLLFADALERLRAAVQRDRPVDAAQLHLINLQEVIRRAGPHWSLIKDKIRLGSMRFLRGCVGDEDIVIPAGDGFLIIFSDGNPGEMKERAEEMRSLLLEFYLGQEEPVRALQVTVEERKFEPRELGALIA